MDEKAQAEGERRVRRLLVEPLLARGLSRPKGFTKADDFEVMVSKTLCPKLAYMTALNLAALEEQIGANPAGRDADQMPIPNDILRCAADIQEPGEEASPLMRAVFAAKIGQDALAGDWAPELLRYLKRKRKWPKGLAVDDIKREAVQAREKLRVMLDREARGLPVPEADLNWRGSRGRAGLKCVEIAAQGAEVGQ